MDVLFESENILFVRPSLDLIPDYLEMVNDIDHVARFIGEHGANHQMNAVSTFPFYTLEGWNMNPPAFSDLPLK